MNYKQAISKIRQKYGGIFPPLLFGLSLIFFNFLFSGYKSTLSDSRILRSRSENFAPQNGSLQSDLEFTNEEVTFSTPLTDDNSENRMLFEKEKLIFQQWLKQLGIHKHYNAFLLECIYTIEDVYMLRSEKAEEILAGDFPIWLKGRRELPANNKNLLIQFKYEIWNNITRSSFSETWTTVLPWILGATMLFIIFFASLAACVWLSESPIRTQTSLVNLVTGRYVDPYRCQVKFCWRDPCTVGSTMKFAIKFFQANGTPHPISNRNDVVVDISVDNRALSCAITLEDVGSSEANQVTISFTARYAGKYKIHITYKGCAIRDSPFYRTFIAGPIDVKKTLIRKHWPFEICKRGYAPTIIIEPKDRYSNPIFKHPSDSIYSGGLIKHFRTVTIRDGVVMEPLVSIRAWNNFTEFINMRMYFRKEGFYNVQLYFENAPFKQGSFRFLVLTDEEYKTVHKNVDNSAACYEGKLVLIEGQPMIKPKHVTVYISPKQVVVKEQVLKFIPKRIANFRVRPSTQLEILNELANGVPILMLKEANESGVYIASSMRSLIAATYARFLQSNIGGSNDFKKKQTYFHYRVQQLHRKERRNSEQVLLNIRRRNLLESSIKATKNFTTKDWLRDFEISFSNEPGIDHGGLRREWFRLVCEALFDPKNDFFKPLSGNSQGLVHPNNKRSPHFTLKYYEFAGRIVGKCLYDSSFPSSCSYYVNAKFTRSFLARVLTLHVNYKYFEFDDPEFYLKKIKYILANDANSMGLYFTEDIYSDSGHLVKVVDLIPNGSKIKVTNKNKLSYLDSLAQYKLITAVKDEIDSFMRGLNDIVPDELLSIFNEDELELLICGTEKYDISDFRAHHTVLQITSSPYFPKVMNWFWVAVDNYTKEEIARLLQFVTCSSRLPPGGFKDLDPPFTLVPADTYGCLPFAHTCFNQLCLPDYDTYEDFERALLLAITEGSGGFYLP